MAGVSSEDSGGGRSTEGISSGQRCLSGEALAEWRSSEQVENGVTSTSPPYWDSDDDDDGGPKPSELYGKYTWKIEKFSQINKRELRSNAFEVGGYKWYILIYPQGCDVSNHLSLFLCVANHDKLLPGWSHFAQFTIAVVNKDPKKSKYSDTLHRFWKKEHDWGWKKFMELTKVLDGFIESDTLIIKAQVQVIREKADRPFRCLDCQYRRELVRVYLTNVEQICRKFVEEKKKDLGKLIEDKSRWSSFCSFWLGIEQNARRRMSRENMDAVLKVVVKHFFVEKEVTSTLVMDSLYSGLKALEGPAKCNNSKVKLLDAEESPAPIVRVEKDMFVLVDDVLTLLERVALEPLPPKDEKGPGPQNQNRTKDGNSGEDFNKDSIERDERRLTELGSRTVEIFVLAHIFSNKIEVAYHESVALKRQEELIREEEAAWQAETDQKARRGATEKEKKAKKKQAKQKRNNRKGKDKVREERPDVAIQEKQRELPIDELKDYTRVEKADTVEDISDVSDSVDGVAEVPPPDSEDRDASPINWDTDTSEVHPPTEPSSSGISGLSSVQNGVSDKKSASVMDDSSSTCSTDSVPSVVMNGPYKGNSVSNYKNQKSPTRGKHQMSKAAGDGSSWSNELENQASGPVADVGRHNDVSASSKGGESESEPAANTLQDRLNWLDKHVVKKEEVVPLQKKLSIKDQVDLQRPLKEKIPAVTSSPESPPNNVPLAGRPKSECQSSAVTDSIPLKRTSSVSMQQTDRVAPSPSTMSSQSNGVSKPETQKAVTPKPSEKAMAQQVPVMSRPSSAPLVPGPRPPTSTVASMVQTAPLLARSVSAAGRLGPDPSPATPSYVPQSYRNAILGNHVPSGSTGFTHTSTSNSTLQPSPAYSQPPPALVSAPMFLPQSPEVMDPNTVTSGFPYSRVSRDVLHSGPQWMESSQRKSSNSMNFDPSSMLHDQSFDFYKPLHGAPHEQFSTDFPVGTSGRQTQGVSAADEFPHLDIINDLLDDEHGYGAARASSVFHSSNGPNHLNRQFSYPGDFGTSSDMESATSSCRFERTRSYQDDGFQRGYTLGSQFESIREFTPQNGPLPYVNGQIDGIIPNQWPMTGSELSLQGLRNADSDGYPYYNTDYSNMTCGVNGYTVFRPSNGQ